jgi:hypothetical protein
MAQVIRHSCRVVNDAEISKTQTAKTPLESGADTPAEAGETLRPDNPENPPTQAASQAKTLFSLTGGLVPIFQPFSGGFALQTRTEKPCLRLSITRIRLPARAG